MTGITALLKRYVSAWNERNPGKRLELLDSCWAEHGVYTDPGVQTSSRVALNDNIGAFLEEHARPCFEGHQRDR